MFVLETIWILQVTQNAPAFWWKSGKKKRPFNVKYAAQPPSALLPRHVGPCLSRPFQQGLDLQRLPHAAGGWRSDRAPAAPRARAPCTVHHFKHKIHRFRYTISRFYRNTKFIIWLLTAPAPQIAGPIASLVDLYAPFIIVTTEFIIFNASSSFSIQHS